jgi:hypothetical protein
MCVWVAIYTLCNLSLLSSLLNSKKVIFGLQKAYLSDSECSPIGYVSDISPTLNFRGVDAGECCAGGTGQWVGAGGANAGGDDGGASLVGTGTNREVVTVDASLGAAGIRSKEVESRSEDVTNGDTSTPEPLGGMLGFGGEQP